MVQFFKDSVRELKHVVWPSQKVTWNYFGLVLTILIAFGLYLWFFNVIFSEFVLNIAPKLVDKIVK